MPIVDLVKVVAGGTSKYQLIGSMLKLKSFEHVVQYQGIKNIGFGYDSCNSVVALKPHAMYDQVSVFKDEPFSLLYGSSRLYKGLDPDYNKKFQIHSKVKQQFALSQHEQHAEQTAILLGEDLGFWTCSEHFNHLYVDFEPCEKCMEWLQKRNEKWLVYFSETLPEKEKLINERKLHRSNTFGRQYE